MRPMLATSGDRQQQVPGTDQWTHEVKWDGMRILAETTRSGVRLASRNERDVTVSWPDVARPVEDGRDLLVDGEVICLDGSGRPDFRTLQQRIHISSAGAASRRAATVPATYMVFDLLRLDGAWLLDQPLARRRELLAGIDLAGTGWQVPDVFDDGAMLLEATRQQQLEGIVSKRLDSRYRPGERSSDWLKFAHRPRTSYVVGGWRPQRGSTDRLGALLVGEMTPDGLVYRGRVGAGVGPASGRRLAALLVGTERASHPFGTDVPAEDADTTTWVEPRLVVDVESLGLTGERLRQPSFKAVRTDLTPDDLLAVTDGS